jgi:release factor glutamine methyltransferase
MAPDTVVTRQAAIAEAAALLARSGVVEPRRLAVRLWADVSGEGAATVYAESAGAPDQDVVTNFRRGADRLAAGEPLAYVTGRIGFRHLVLRCDRRALIPRPETEGLVDLLLGRISSGRVADLGTGSGCLALSLASEGGFERVVGVDCTPGALALAAENRDRLGGRVDLVLGDLCRPLRAGAFDALVANPPYLTSGEYAALDRSVRDWEPETALASGADGLAATTRLLDEGREVLRPGGWLALEIDSSRGGECAGRAGAMGWTEVAIDGDLFGRERYLLARRSETR